MLKCFDMRHAHLELFAIVSTEALDAGICIQADKVGLGQRSAQDKAATTTCICSGELGAWHCFTLINILVWG